MSNRCVDPSGNSRGACSDGPATLRSMFNTLRTLAAVLLAAASLLASGPGEPLRQSNGLPLPPEPALMGFDLRSDAIPTRNLAPVMVPAPCGTQASTPVTSPPPVAYECEGCDLVGPTAYFRAPGDWFWTTVGTPAAGSNLPHTVGPVTVHFWKTFAFNGQCRAPGGFCAQKTGCSVTMNVQACQPSGVNYFLTGQPLPTEDPIAIPLAADCGSEDSEHIALWVWDATGIHIVAEFLIEMSCESCG